jgi:hypothetical protein
MRLIHTIGKHLRHARDHFMALMESIRGPMPHILDYDARKRDTPMEGSLAAARKALRETIDWLEEKVQKVPLDEPLTLQAITPFKQTVQSSFGREACIIITAVRIQQLISSLLSSGFVVCTPFTIGQWYVTCCILPHALRLTRPSQVRVIAGEMVQGTLCSLQYALNHHAFHRAFVSTTHLASLRPHWSMKEVTGL